MEIYTRSNCNQCKTIKELFRQYNIEYKEHIIDETITREEVMAKFPGRKVLPVVVDNEGILPQYPMLKYCNIYLWSE